MDSAAFEVNIDYLNDNWSAEITELTDNQWLITIVYSTLDELLKGVKEVIEDWMQNGT